MKRLALCLLWPALAQAEPPTPDDFAYGVELAPLRAQTFHRYPLPASVMRTLTTEDLRDLCVFDAQGQLSAHALAWPSSLASSRALPLYPLEVTRQAIGTEVVVERDGDGRVTRTLSRPLERESSARGYLIDARELGGPLRALTLTFSTHSTPSLLRVRIEGSTELTTFTELVALTLAPPTRDAAHGEHGRASWHAQLELPHFAGAYLRVSFEPGPGSAALEQARARAADMTQASRGWLALPGEPVKGEPQSFGFTVPAALRIDRYKVALPPGTAMIQASLYGAERAHTNMLLLDRQLYRTPARELPVVEMQARTLQLRVDAAGGGVRGGAPTLWVGYRAPELLFAGDGQAPYLLAYGSHERGCSALGAAALAPEASSTQSVRALRTRRLGGTARLHASRARDLPVYALWALLLAAVTVLGVSARRLLRRLR